MRSAHADLATPAGELMTSDEVAQLAGGIKTPARQLARLRKMGVPARMEEGVLVVSRVLVREWIKGAANEASGGANWGAVN